MKIKFYISKDVMQDRRIDVERFTKKNIVAGIERSYVNDDDCFDTWTVPRKFEGPAIERLAAYEDTGLEPEEVAALAEAEQDGRLVVLPCKVGEAFGADKRGRGVNYSCSACNKSYPYICDYCPSCGAKMDLE